LRKNPNVLMEGDRVFVPDRKDQTFDIGTGARHRFKRLGVPAKLQIQFIDETDKAMARLAYRLDVDGNLTNGTTDDDGWLIESIPPAARKGKVIFDNGKTFDLQLGHLDPLDTVAGVQDRLKNLGYSCGHDHRDELGTGTLAAIRAYRATQGLSIPDELSESVLEETRKQLAKQHHS
jgi:N-acetylmuramoyl-L-alanine amidase